MKAVSSANIIKKFILTGIARFLIIMLKVIAGRPRQWTLFIQDISTWKKFITVVIATAIKPLMMNILNMLLRRRLLSVTWSTAIRLNVSSSSEDEAYSEMFSRNSEFINVTVFVSNLCWAPTCLSNETINKYRGKNLFVKDFRLFLSHLGD